MFPLSLYDADLRLASGAFFTRCRTTSIDSFAERRPARPFRTSVAVPPEIRQPLNCFRRISATGVAAAAAPAVEQDLDVMK
jgi:hypothetical protein